MNRVALVITALATSSAMPTLKTHAVLASPETPVLSPSDMQKKMGMGINLGNRWDLYEQPPRVVKQSFFTAFAMANFTNCRIPVCWDLSKRGAQ